MKFHRMDNRARAGFTTFGAFWPKGSVSEGSSFTAGGKDGEQIPLQSEITAYWPDHSVKWTAHSVDAGRLPDETEITASAPVSGKTDDSRENIRVSESDTALAIEAGTTSVVIPKSGSHVFEHFRSAAAKEIEYGEETLILERTEKADDSRGRGSWSDELNDIVRRDTVFTGNTEEVKVESLGPLMCTVRISGRHVSAREGRTCCPFILRITLWKDSPRMDFEHTYIYDGDPDHDALKGLGIRFYTALSHQPYNRQVKFLTDHGSFHEPAVLMTSWHPRIPVEDYRAQTAGEPMPENGEAAAFFLENQANMPIWSDYCLVQDSSEHFLIQKRTQNDNCCYIPALNGRRAGGAMAFGDPDGGFMVARKDFWQKAPSGLEVKNLTPGASGKKILPGEEDEDKKNSAKAIEEELARNELTEADVWFYAPQAGAFDYRHYAVKGYSQTYYEGFDVYGADPVGTANTNLFSLQAYNGPMSGVTDSRLEEFLQQVRKPAIFLEDVRVLHDNRAFGYWSLPAEAEGRKPGEVEQWLERQLDSAFDFYKKEQEQRLWYGFYDYGDVMHTYDPVRHVWKYDIGGYAWDNTELMPTMWLWLYFMRTQREDVFTFAEALSRHTADVDVYHIGKYKGLGSRHNVRHWGCPCKEARIGMAGNHRVFYYITGDRRMRDIFEDDRDADYTVGRFDPLRFFYDKEKMVCPTHARSGPDWSSFVANWMTQWERFDDQKYLGKIRTGIEDLKKLPLQLVSGPDFEYDPETSHLRYINERATGGTHLQICQGAAETWLELSTLLDDPEWTKMLADYGWFYFLPYDVQRVEGKGLLGTRVFTIPFMASAMGAFGAKYRKDKKLAGTVWSTLLAGRSTPVHGRSYTEVSTLKNEGNQSELREIPWVSTNDSAQWCLNVILTLEFIRDELPDTWDGVDRMFEETPPASAMQEKSQGWVKKK
ncbi:MAG: hypothetical protein ACOX8B_07135 [Lachnospiraceae bacterium]|jgi:hypothetical protein